MFCFGFGLLVCFSCDLSCVGSTCCFRFALILLFTFGFLLVGLCCICVIVVAEFAYVLAVLGLCCILFVGFPVGLFAFGIVVCDVCVVCCGLICLCFIVDLLSDGYT